MAYSPEASALRRVAVAKLPRITDRISFLSLDRCRIVQGRTGVIALLEEGEEVPVPGGSLTVLMLGPGVSITTPALRTLANSGCITMASTAAADGCYTTAMPLTSSGAWACAQATLWADVEERTKAAVKLYRVRFDDDLPAGVTIAQLRGLEGRRMKAAYKEHAARAGLPNWRRIVEEGSGTANSNLNMANGILYGVAAAVCGAFGLSPSLGVIHQGAVNAFLFDLADCFKTSVSLPAAFACARRKDSERATSAEVRIALRKQRVLGKMARLVADLFDPYLPKNAGSDVLFGPEGSVPGHTNYHDKAATDDTSDVPEGEPF